MSPPTPPSRRRRVAFAAALSALASACASPSQQRVQADRESYDALDLRRTRVPEVAGSLNVDAARDAADPLRGLTHVDLDLKEAFRLAALASRDYLDQRETAYLTALAYTEERHRFEAQFALGIATGLERVPGATSGSATPAGSVSKSFEAGGTFVLKVATDFLKNFTGDPVNTARTLLTTDLLIPIGRGSGTLVARERLTQAELDVLYALRTFARFQQDLVVRVASGFYRVLEARDTLANEEANYKSLELVHQRALAFGPEHAGRLPDFAVDQARQNVLIADERRTRARLDYEEAIDAYKLDLGIPVRVQVTVHDDALDLLRARGIVAPSLDLGRAVDESLSRRLDLANARDQREDALRRVAVAEQGLGADVNLRLGADLVGPDQRPYDLRSSTGRARAGIDLDLPLERTAERNAYRAAQVQADRAERAVEALEDRVISQVRTAWRTLLAAEKSFAIQQEGVRLAERRVESAKLNLQAGKAEIRDVLDAEAALVASRNALTSALVDHAVARLELERDAGVLETVALVDAGTVARPATPAPPPSPAAPAAGAPTPPPTATAPGSAAPEPPAGAAPPAGAPPAGPAVPAPTLPAK